MLRGDRSRESDQEEVESLTDKDHHPCDGNDVRRRHSKRLPVRNKPVSFFGRLTKLKSQTADDRSHKVRRCLSWEHSSYSTNPLPSTILFPHSFYEHRYMVLWCLYVGYYSIITAIYAISAVKIYMQEIFLELRRFIS